MMILIDRVQSILQIWGFNFRQKKKGSMSQVVGLPNNSFKPITNTAWVRARLCKLQKRVHSSDKVYQLLAHGRWFSLGTPASSTTKTGWAKKKYMCVYCHMSKKSRVGRHYYFFFLTIGKTGNSHSGIRFRYFIFEISGKPSFVL